MLPEIVTLIDEYCSGSFVLGRVQCSYGNTCSFGSDFTDSNTCSSAPTSPAPDIGADMLVVTWQPLSDYPDDMFLQINSDSICRHAYSLEQLKNTPEVECTYTFDGTNLLNG